jgi:hypothetical protein
MSEEQPSIEQPAEAPFVDVQRTEAPPVEPPANDPRRRLRELLAIPERDRADAVWDEIISLEIDLAPGNRAQTPQGDVARRQESGRRPEQQGRRPEQARRQDPARAKPGGGRFFKKRKRGSGSPPER